MGYRDDAFYKLPSSESDAEIPRANAKFAYPGNQIRFLAAQSELDNNGNNDDAVSRRYLDRTNSYTIKRGYIRGLSQPGIGADLKPIKCSFQFNPQTILQTVEMRPDMYLPILQDPSQFSQPLGSSVNFNFDLVFDRSHEVANGRVPGSTKYTAANIDSPDYANDAGDIGAMSDLQVLYSIIGQGFSKELVEFQAKRLEQVSNRKSQETEGYEAVSLDQIKKSISEANVGNAAFLIPNPVRVMFSSLFMVDGFVTGTTVDYLKFSTNMVPLQIKVGVSMSAIYIGFAKRRTFLTDQLEAAGVAAKDLQAAQVAEQKELSQLAVKDLRNFVYGGSEDKDWRNAVNDRNDDSGYDDDIPPARFAVSSPSGAITMNTGYPDFAKDGLTDLIKDGQAITLNYSWTLKVYGPYNTFELARDDKNKASIPTDKLVGNFSGSVSSGDEFFFNKTFPDLQNNAEGLPLPESSYYTKFFVTRMRVNASINGSNGGDTSISAVDNNVVRGGATSSFTTLPYRLKISGKMFMPWLPNANNKLK